VLPDFGPNSGCELSMSTLAMVVWYEESACDVYFSPVTSVAGAEHVNSCAVRLVYINGLEPANVIPHGSGQMLC